LKLASNWPDHYSTSFSLIQFRCKLKTRLFQISFCNWILLFLSELIAPLIM
jgi:hypothetical protein